jgi:hypothetical protein
VYIPNVLPFFSLLGKCVLFIAENALLPWQRLRSLHVGSLTHTSVVLSVVMIVNPLRLLLWGKTILRSVRDVRCAQRCCWGFSRECDALLLGGSVPYVSNYSTASIFRIFYCLSLKLQAIPSFGTSSSTRLSTTLRPRTRASPAAPLWEPQNSHLLNCGSQ